MTPLVVTDASALRELRGQVDRTPAVELEGLLGALRRASPMPGWSFAQTREQFEDNAARLPMPDGVEHAEVTVAGRRALLLTPDTPTDRVCVYLHGGAFTIGSPDTARALAARTAQAIRALTLVVDYRLAPEHPWPAGHDDAVAAIAWAAERAQHLVVAGDSAGGGLAIAAAIDAARRDCPADAVVAMSPWVDLDMPHAQQMDLSRDPQAPRWMLERSAQAYRRSGESAASPLSDDLTLLPPTLVQVGSAETLLDDSLALADRAYGLGAESLTLEYWTGMPHVWQAFAPRLPAANEALDRIGSWVDRVLG